MLNAGALGIQDRAGAECEREIHSISQSIGEEKFRGGEGHVVRMQPEHALGVIARGDQHIAVAMDRSFWCSSAAGGDRKSTRLNSSHVASSYAVFCLKKK